MTDTQNVEHADLRQSMGNHPIMLGGVRRDTTLQNRNRVFRRGSLKHRTIFQNFKIAKFLHFKLS